MLVSINIHFLFILCKIFDRFFDIADKVTYEEVLTGMTNHRKLATFPIPDDLTELIQNLENLDQVKNFYKGGFEAADGSMGLVFVRPGMVRPLKSARRFLGDGTFAILARNPKFAQLYTIHFQIFDTVI